MSHTILSVHNHIYNTWPKTGFVVNVKAAEKDHQQKNPFYDFKGLFKMTTLDLKTMIYVHIIINTL